MFKLITFCTFLFLLLCHPLLGKAQQETVNGTQRNSKNNKIVIGYSGCAPSTDFWNKLSWSLRKQAKEMGAVFVDFSAEDFSLSRQKKNIVQAIDIQIDGMILGAVSDGLEESVTLLQQHGIPVVTVGVPIQHRWISTHVGTSSEEAAILAGKYIRDNASRYNTGKRVVIISGDADQENAHIRGNTPARILRDAGYHVTVLFSEDWSGVKALQHALREFSIKTDEISAVFSAFEPASVAMVEAAEKFELNALLVGFDWSDTMRDMLIQGRLHAAIVQNPQLIGRKGLQAMVEVLRGKTPPTLIDVPPVLIAKDDVESY